MAVEVLVVQHAEKAQAAGDPELTEAGLRQAPAVAAGLREAGARVGAV